MNKEALIEQLNAAKKEDRLAALRALKQNFAIRGEGQPCYVNNHIHTTYSFSPYSPAKAAYMAYAAGLETAGIMDHDSLGGAREFIEAGEILGLPVTIGIETRVNMRDTAFAGRLINNPDQRGIAYMALHGIPHTQIDRVCERFAAVRAQRNVRNAAMSARIAALVAPYGIDFDFTRDVLPGTLAEAGGTVTERTLCGALAAKIIAKVGKGPAVSAFLEEKLGLTLPETIRSRLSDPGNEHYSYDLLGALKGGLVSQFYVDADAECLTLAEYVAFGREIGAIVAYAYLGDVTASVTGDKKAQKFEDDYLDELFAALRAAGVCAIAYMPSRNSGEQLARLRQLCGKEGLFEISGEDINSSRQSFICPQLAQTEFAHLIHATWALIGHERAATRDIAAGMFSEQTIAANPALEKRIEIFERYGRGQ